MCVITDNKAGSIAGIYLVPNIFDFSNVTIYWFSSSHMTVN